MFKDEHALWIEDVVNQSGDILRERFSVQKVPGKLEPPLPPLNRDVEEIRSPSGRTPASTKEVHKDVVVLFDGLDRLLDATKFWSVVHQDLRVAP